MTRETTFFEGWSWFKFNNSGLGLGTTLKFSASVAKGLKLKVRKFWGLFPTFVEVTGVKLAGGFFGPCSRPPPSPILNKIRLCDAETSLDETIKSINSQTNNDGLKEVFYKHFSNKLAPILLDVYGSREKLGTIGITSRTVIISAIYKKDDKRNMKNYRPILFLNLNYNIYITILTN